MRTTFIIMLSVVAASLRADSFVSNGAKQSRITHDVAIAQSEAVYKAAIRKAATAYLQSQIKAKTKYLAGLRTAKGSLRDSKLSLDSIARETELINAETKKVTAELILLRKQLGSAKLVKSPFDFDRHNPFDKPIPEKPEIAVKSETTPSVNPSATGKPTKLATVTITANLPVVVGTLVKSHIKGGRMTPRANIVLRDRGYCRYVIDAPRWIGLQYSMAGNKVYPTYTVTATTDGAILVIGKDPKITKEGTTIHPDPLPEPGISMLHTSVGPSAVDVCIVNVKKGDTITIMQASRKKGHDRWGISIVGRGIRVK